MGMSKSLPVQKYPWNMMERECLDRGDICAGGVGEIFSQDHWLCARCSIYTLFLSFKGHMAPLCRGKNRPAGSKMHALSALEESSRGAWSVEINKGKQSTIPLSSFIHSFNESILEPILLGGTPYWSSVSL
jgi:hypothetical protein